MIFSCYGHENIKASHPTTLEFTKDTHLTPTGDCIVGIDSDFDLQTLKKLKGRIMIRLKVDDIEDTLEADINDDFSDEKEIVIRKTDFISRRTLAINATRSSKELNRKMIKKLKDPKQKLEVEIVEKNPQQ